jgi:formate hydrogenlyase subunit 3/multisubunit Na+/H+ antiporter MnhD subunit
VVNHGITKALAFFAAGTAIARYGSRDIHVIRGLLDRRSLFSQPDD